MEIEQKLAEAMASALEPGEKLRAATDADHRSTSGSVVGFLFSGLFSNLVAKGEEGKKTGDDETHLPFGPVAIGVTDQRVLFFSRDIDLKDGPLNFVAGLPPEAIKGVRRGKDPLTDTMLIDFADGTELKLSLDTFNHSKSVIHEIHELCGLVAGE